MLRRKAGPRLPQASCSVCGSRLGVRGLHVATEGPGEGADPGEGAGQAGRAAGGGEGRKEHA